MDEAQLEKTISKLEIIYDQLWAAGYKTQADALNEVTNSLYEELTLKQLQGVSK